jgi:hypothetical protein
MAKREETLNVTRSSQTKRKGSPVSVGSREATLVSRTGAGRVEAPSFLQGAISVFIVFHLIAIICWTVPNDFLFVVEVRDLVGPYMQWTALTQSWDTFAPDPKAVNAYVKAVVITRKHHIHVWTFPRMEQLSFTERYRKERYRKFAENLVEEKNAILWPDIARHVAGLYKNPADPPDKVMLVEFLADITPWADKDDAGTPRPIVFYEDFLEPEALR